MVCGDDHDASGLVDGGLETSEAEVDRLDTDADCLEDPRVAHHVAIGVVAPDVAVFPALDRLDERVGDFGSLHPGALLEGHDIRGDLHILLELFVNVPGLVSIIEVCDMTELLGLRACKRSDPRRGEVFPAGAVDCGRADQVAFRDMEVAVILPA